MHPIPRREFIVSGGAALTAIALLQSSRDFAYASRAGESVVPWLDELCVLLEGKSLPRRGEWR
jgi:hypothetical protein